MSWRNRSSRLRRSSSNACAAAGNCCFAETAAARRTARTSRRNSTCRFKEDRRPYPAIALTVDAGLLTAIGNDYAFQDIFERQVRAYGKSGDVLIALTTSGKSRNVLSALEEARRLGLHTIAFLGKGGGFTSGAGGNRTHRAGHGDGAHPGSAQVPASRDVRAGRGRPAKGMIPAVAAAVIGAIIGSFLNACIHRMPRGIPLGNPKRSFCPSCNRSIPWYENLPLVSWILLRGKCRGCGAPISPRYLIVEAITAAAFLAIWLQFRLPLAPVYWLFLSLLIVATFIDIEHFIIPDQITIGGAVCGLAASAVFPQMMDAETPWWSLAWSLIGASIGFGILFAVVELGKLAFGRKRHRFDPPEDFSWAREGEKERLRVGEEVLFADEIFARHSDMLTIEADELVLDGEPLPQTILKFYHDRLVLADGERPLDSIREITGKVRSVIIPREAMGFGDVKFMAMIGAFLGWKAVLFTIAASSVIGSVAALAGLFLAKDRSGARLPYGPFLALGAAIWVFGGNLLWEWYFNRFHGLIGDF